jgi:HSP20 family protein
MNALIKNTDGIRNLFKNANDIFFGRGIDDILKHDFFNSLDANTREDRNGYLLEIAVPGMTRKDIKIQVEGPIMTVTAKKQQRNDSWSIAEFNSSMFHRLFALPKDADSNDIKAKCRHGLLTIQIGKQKGSHRSVKIQGEEINKYLPGYVTSWWHGIRTRMVDLLKR